MICCNWSLPSRGLASKVIAYCDLHGHQGQRVSAVLSLSTASGIVHLQAYLSIEYHLSQRKYLMKLTVLVAAQMCCSGICLQMTARTNSDILESAYHYHVEVY